MFRGSLFYVPPKQLVDDAFLDLQKESLEMLKKEVAKSVFAYSEIERLLEAITNLQKYFAKKINCEQERQDVIALKNRLMLIDNETKPFISQYYPKTLTLPTCRRSTTSLIFNIFLSKNEAIFVNKILPFLLLEEQVAISKVNHSLYAYTDKVKFTTPYAYVKKGKIIIQLNHLTSAPSFKDFKFCMNLALNEMRFLFWKTSLDRMETVPLKLLQLEKKREAELKLQHR